MNFEFAHTFKTDFVFTLSVNGIRYAIFILSSDFYLGSRCYEVYCSLGCFFTHKINLSISKE